ncbi:MAG: hypothetical protein JO316_04875 [Abitibacteriaceae bacterium]|nr:hypothetical protein [Abditibacteriaceae bacterium]
MAFGSRQVESAVELRWKEVEGGHIAVDLRARVLLFDWWVNNPDHILSSTGGNPNLLWATAEQQLHLIDHNLAFSPNMMSASLFDFATEHVFGADLLVDEARFWEEPESKLGPLTNATIELDTFWQQNRRELPRIWNDLPEEWTEATLGFTLEEVQQQLDRINMQFEDFWGTSTTTEGAEEG